jgi:membrane-associated phospholipid phosphatase
MNAETGTQEALSQVSQLGRETPGGGRERAWLAVGRHRMAVGWAVLALAFVLSSAVAGIPFSEDTVLLWLAAALFVASLGDLRRWRRGVVRDWLPLYVVLIGYALLRGYASHVLWGPFVQPQLAFDKFIGGGETPTVRLQQWLFNPNSLHVWDYGTWAVYTTHFFVSYIVAAVLWKRDYTRFKRFIALYVGLTFIGYAGYVLYPAMPPWLASDTGYIPAISRIVPAVWSNVGVHEAAALFLHGAKVANDIAAMPSLHAAYPMLLLLFFWAKARPWMRALLVGYVLVMAFSLVYLGEHFVIDEVAGWCAAAAVYFGGSRLLDWRQRRRQQQGQGQGQQQRLWRPWPRPGGSRPGIG